MISPKLTYIFVVLLLSCHTVNCPRRIQRRIQRRTRRLLQSFPCPRLLPQPKKLLIIEMEVSTVVCQFTRLDSARSPARMALWIVLLVFATRSRHVIPWQKQHQTLPLPIQLLIQQRLIQLPTPPLLILHPIQLRYQLHIQHLPIFIAEHH